MRRMTFGERSDLIFRLYRYSLVLIVLGCALIAAGVGVTVKPEVEDLISLAFSAAPFLGLLCLILGLVATALGSHLQRREWRR